MGLIDSHAHLTYPDFAGRMEEVIMRCAECGVEAVITIGTSLEDARSAIDLARRYPGRIYAAAGFHPHEADKVSDDDLKAMGELWGEPLRRGQAPTLHRDVVAFGEMGLDYHYDFAERANQRRVFAAQLTAARERDRPVIIHCRDAFADCEPMLVDHGFAGRPVVFHCFTGTAEEAAQIAERGWRVSFTGIVTFPKSTELQAIAREYPADKLMLETDSPYLSPVPVRGKKPNEPAHVAHVARFLAELRGVSYDSLVAQTRTHTREFFGLA